MCCYYIIVLLIFLSLLVLAQQPHQTYELVAAAVCCCCWEDFPLPFFSCSAVFFNQFSVGFLLFPRNEKQQRYNNDTVYTVEYYTSLESKIKRYQRYLIEITGKQMQVREESCKFCLGASFAICLVYTP